MKIERIMVNKWKNWEESDWFLKQEASVVLPKDRVPSDKERSEGTVLEMKVEIKDLNVVDCDTFDKILLTRP